MSLGLGYNFLKLDVFVSSSFCTLHARTFVIAHLFLAFSVQTAPPWDTELPFCAVCSVFTQDQAFAFCPLLSVYACVGVGVGVGVYVLSI